MRLIYSTNNVRPNWDFEILDKAILGHVFITLYYYWLIYNNSLLETSKNLNKCIKFDKSYHLYNNKILQLFKLDNKWL